MRKILAFMSLLLFFSTVQAAVMGHNCPAIGDFDRLFDQIKIDLSHLKMQVKEKRTPETQLRKSAVILDLASSELLIQFDCLAAVFQSAPIANRQQVLENESAFVYGQLVQSSGDATQTPATQEARQAIAHTEARFKVIDQTIQSSK
jgi:hypothetical protein